MRKHLVGKFKRFYLPKIFLFLFKKTASFQSKEISTFGDLGKISGGVKVRPTSNQMSTADCATLYRKKYLVGYDRDLIIY